MATSKRVMIVSVRAGIVVVGTVVVNVVDEGYDVVGIFVVVVPVGVVLVIDVDVVVDVVVGV